MGLNCMNCCRGGTPYLTAYEIAVKHGFRGTEAEWLASMDRVRIVKVTGRSGDSFTCDQDLATIKEWSKDHVVMLILPDGGEAHLSGIAGSAVFTTAWYESGEGQAYDAWIIGTDTCIVEKRVIEWSSETREMTWNDIKPAGGIRIYDLGSDEQQSLFKADTAYQKPTYGIPATDLASDVFAGLLDRRAQATWTPGYTEQIAVDAQGRLWALARGESTGGEETVQYVQMTYYDGDVITDLSAEQIFNILEEAQRQSKHVCFILIDRQGRQCLMCAPPELPTSDAKFFTYDLSNDDTIVYSISASGIVSSSVSNHYKKPFGGIPWVDLEQPATVLLELESGDLIFRGASFDEIYAAYASQQKVTFLCEIDAGTMTIFQASKADPTNKAISLYSIVGNTLYYATITENVGQGYLSGALSSKTL